VSYGVFEIHSIEDNPFAEEIPSDAVMDALPVTGAPMQSPVVSASGAQMADSLVQQQLGADSFGQVPAGNIAIAESVSLGLFEIHSIEDNPFAEEIPSDAVMDALPVTGAPMQSPIVSAPGAQMAGSLAQQQPDHVMQVPASVEQNTSLRGGGVVAQVTEKIEQVPVETHAEEPRSGAVQVQPGQDSTVVQQGNVSLENVPSAITVQDKDEGSSNIGKLREQIVQLEESIRSLHQLYMDGIIEKSRYDNTKEHIEDGIRNDKVHISIETQRKVMDNLKVALDRDVEAALDNKDYQKEVESIKADLDRLERLREYKVIDDETYESSKLKIHNRMERMSTLIADINNVVDMDFKRYSASFEDELRKQKEKSDGTAGAGMTKEDDKKEVAVIQEVENKEDDSKKTIIQRIMGLFKIGKKQNQIQKTEDAVGSKYKEELENISKIEPKRDALIELRLLLKKEIQSKHNIDRQLTYEQLILELAKIKADEKFNAELVSFFKETSDAEYKGVIKEDDFMGIYNAVVVYLKKMEAIVGPGAPDKKGKKKGEKKK